MVAGSPIYDQRQILRYSFQAFSAAPHWYREQLLVVSRVRPPKSGAGPRRACRNARSRNGRYGAAETTASRSVWRHLRSITPTRLVGLRITPLLKPGSTKVVTIDGRPATCRRPAAVPSRLLVRSYRYGHRVLSGVEQVDDGVDGVANYHDPYGPTVALASRISAPASMRIVSTAPFQVSASARNHCNTV